MTTRRALQHLGATIALGAPLVAGAAGAAPALRIEPAPLPRCLEQIAAATGARFIVSPALAEAAPACGAVEGATSAAMALDAALRGRDVAWRLREDGVYLVVSAAPAPAGTLDTLAVRDTALDGDAAATAQRPAAPRPAFTDLATATTGYDRAELAAKPLARFNQLSRLAPNVYSSGESLSIRGVPRDNDYFTGNGVFLDGIDVGTLLLDHNLLAVDELASLRFERGGTAFALGSGVTGGAIHLETPDPLPQWGVDATLRGGERSASLARLAVEGPLTPAGEASGRVALSTRADPRFVRSAVVPAIDGDTDRRDDAQAKLRWEPEALPGFTLDLAGFHVEGDAPDRVMARPATTPAADLFDRVSFDTTAIDYDLRATGRGLRAAYDAGPVGLGAWADDLRAAREGLALVEPAGNAFSGDEEMRRRIGLGGALSIGASWRLYAALERKRVERADTLLRTRLPTPQGVPGSVERTQNVLAIDSDSLLAEAAWTQGPWRATAGARWVDEDVVFRFRQRLALGGVPVEDQTTRDTRSSYRRALPAAALERALGAGAAIGASWSRGYRSGGDSERISIGEYAPETLDTAELWWHGGWLDDRVGLRASVFRTDWRDRTAIDGTIGAVIVRPFETRIDGAELEWDAALGESLALRGGIGWLDARHRSGRYRLGVVEYDLDGRRAADAPRSTLSLGALWRNDSGWSAALDAYRAGSAESSTFVEGPRTVPSPARRGAYTVLDARIAWQGEHFGVALAATNLLDEEYIDRYVERRANSRILGDPRQVDLTLTWSW